MIASGELEGELPNTSETEESKSPSFIGYDASERVRGTFYYGTEHLQRQREQGIDSADRMRRIIRLLLVLMALGFVIWYFFLR